MNKKESSRIMGEQSISKSYKGILRISHIMELIDGEPDDFLNPKYYGNPDKLLNISGGSYSSESFCYQTPITGMSNNMRRYNSSNIRIDNDILKLNRLPLTDSMGNYLNWNIGTNGVTIGSDDNINGVHNFPILESKEIVIGLENKILPNNKKGVTDSLLSIESGNHLASLVIENDKDVSEKESYTAYFTNTSGETETVQLSNYKKPKENIKFRTEYKADKNYPEEFDVFMYNQNDWENTDNIITSTTNISNLKQYVKNIVNTYMQSNVIEVPSGAVIYQYCSLEKWRAYGDDISGNSTDLIGGKGFPGHRPALQIKSDDGSSPFFNSTIQGACRKQNRLRKNNSSDESSQQEDENISDYNTYTQEIIPLYKRDYLLCDGSVYRIPFTVNLKNKGLVPLKEHMDRFFELFFNIGYKYTLPQYMMVRPRFKWDESTQTYRLFDSSSPSGNTLITKNNVSNSVPSVYDKCNKIIDTPPYNAWEIKRSSTFGTGIPYMIDVTNPLYDNCDDLDVLFGEDIATMLACNLIYDHYKTFGTPSEGWQQWLSKQNLPEEYIFNSFIGDSNESVKSYTNRTNQNVSVIEFTYNAINTTPTILIGREVTTFGSPIKIYNTDTKTYEITTPSNLPMVTFFMDLMESPNNYDGSLQQYFYSFFNYNFQVPKFMSEDGSPLFIGSGAYGDSQENYKKIKTPQSWSSNLSRGQIPHRHGIFHSFIDESNGGGTDEARELNYSDTNKLDFAERFGNCPTITANDPVTTISYVSGENKKYQSGSSHGWKFITEDNTGNYMITPWKRKYMNISGAGYSPTKIISLVNPIDDSVDKNAWTVKKKEIKRSKEFISNEIGLVDEDGFVNNQNFSMTIDSDPRFINGEPNRGLTSEPIYDSSKDTGVTYFKGEDAANNYWLAESSNWFAPENIQMLPLIKI